MNSSIKVVLSVLALFAAFAGVRYALDTYRDKQAMTAAHDKIEEIKQRAAQNHPELPPSVAQQQEAVAVVNEELNNEKDKTKRIAKAAGSFFGFYLVNVRERADFCHNAGVEITPFISEFKKIHIEELERARTIIASEGVTEEKIYTIIRPQLGPLVEQDMNDIENSYHLTDKEACQLFVTKGEAIADEMHISHVQPLVYQVLMNK